MVIITVSHASILHLGCHLYISMLVLAETQRCRIKGSQHAGKMIATLRCCSSVSYVPIALHAGGSEQGMLGLTISFSCIMPCGVVFLLWRV